MALYPSQVAVNEANIAKVVETYQVAYKEILAEIATATNWGVSNRKAILAQIEQILEGLGVDVEKFIERELPKYYKSGARDAVTQLKNVHAPVPVATGFNVIHQDAITALVDETSAAFGEALAGVNRKAQLVFGRMSREAITQKMATGMVSGAALKEVRQQIKGQLLEDGLSALVDRGGHTWSLDRYAEMLFRTKAVETRNRGIINRLVENEYDLVQVSKHAGSCDECAEWEGMILSSTGATKGYPTIADAEAGGLFHPNCRHAINALIPKLARQTHAYDPDTQTLTPAGATLDPKYTRVPRPD